MSEILSIEKLREMANIVIDIPNFENNGTIKVRVQRPRLMAMASQGKIPNHLMSIAVQMVTGRKNASNKNNEDIIKDASLMLELYCKACLVEPSYEEFKDIMTDDQADAIFSWAMGLNNKLDSFRKNKGNGSSNNNGETLQEKTK